MAKLFDKAEWHLRKAIELNPQHAGYRVSLGSMLIQEDVSINDGLEIIEQLLVSYPDAPILLLNKAEAYFKLGRYEEALQLVNRADENFSGFLNDAYQLRQEIELALAAQ